MTLEEASVEVLATRLHAIAGIAHGTLIPFSQCTDEQRNDWRERARYAMSEAGLVPDPNTVSPPVRYLLGR